MKARVIIGANYGDEGKGKVTASYTKHAKGPVLNVLTNGGAQRGHTIFLPENELMITNKHFGSGTAYGADSFFSEWFILNPMQFAKEFDFAFSKNNLNKVQFYRHPACLWSTPWDMMASIIMNKGKFASCGMGIWETMLRYRNMKTYTLSEFSILPDTKKIDYFKRIKAYYAQRLGRDIPSEFHDPWNNIVTSLHFIMDCEFMVKNTIVTSRPDYEHYDEVIFENGQGLMLCDAGIDEHDKTPSMTNSWVARQLLQGEPFTPNDITLHYVTRPYITRHGFGDLECGEEKNLTSYLTQDTNVRNEFQGDFRYGKLDIEYLKERILCDRNNFNIMVEVTHCDEMDRLNEFEKAFGDIAVINSYDSKYIL